MNDNDNVLIKLFDTLKEASDKNEAATQKLIIQQLELVNHIKYMPIEDLKKALEAHARESNKKAEGYAGNAETQTGAIMELLRSINTKITKLFIIVTACVTIATGGYFIIRYAADMDNGNKNFTAWEERHEAIESNQEKAMDEKLNRFMDEIRKQMNTLHADDKEQVDEPIHE